MEQVKDILPKTLESLEQPSKVHPSNTRVWAKFQDFQTLNDPQLERMKFEAASFIDDLFQNRTPRWLSFLGSTGSGKTMVAKLIWRLFADHRHTQINWPLSMTTEGTAKPQIFRWRGGFINWGKAVNNRMLQGDYAFLEDLREYNFFAIDDLLSEYEKHRSLSASKLYDVLESRLGKWTVLTANVSLSQIGELLDPRIASRMIRNNSVVVDVDLPDWNLRAASNPSTVDATTAST
jgi:DNA replication protein DnaC